MSDRDEIIQLLNLYAFALDTQRWELFDRVFTEDCDVDYGVTSHWTSRASFKADFGAFHALFDATQHFMSNQLVTADGDTANAHTYFNARLIRHAAGEPPIWDGTGYYDDRLQRTGDGWRISKRVCRVVSWTGNPKVQAPMEDIEFQLDLVSLHGEATEGRLNYLDAIPPATASG